MSDPVTFHISPYGSAASAMQTMAKDGLISRQCLHTSMRRPAVGHRKPFFQVWVAFSKDLDKGFTEKFRQLSTPDSRLLVMNERQSSDLLCTRLMDLQIRTAERLYVADCFGSTMNQTSHYLAALIQRLTAVSGTEESSNRILDAKLENEILRVVSPQFKRLDVPLAEISALQGKSGESINEFEIDEDGSFIYWPQLDVHLGWEQLEQIINPAAALKARQKQTAFNARYGHAVKKFREESGIKPAEIADLSEKQLARIERGECRLTSNAIEILAKAHQLSPNEYLNKITECLRQPSAHSFHTVISGSYRFVPKSRKNVAR